MFILPGVASDDQLDLIKESCPLQGPLADSDSADTEDELEAVRSVSAVAEFIHRGQLFKSVLEL